MKFYSRLFSLILTLLIATSTMAQNPHADRLDSSDLSQQGKLFTLKVVPGEKDLRVFIAGREQMKLQFEAQRLTARVRNNDQSFTSLRVVKKENHFSIPMEELKARTRGQLELTTHSGLESETFEIDLK